MKVSKSLVGKRVCLTWRDPCEWRAEGQHELDIPPSRDQLPLWEDCGWISAVIDGLVKITHTRCFQNMPEKNREAQGHVVFEDLIDTLEVWPDVPVPAKESG